MGLTSPDDVATLTRVSFMIVSTSRSIASTVSIAGDFPVPGLQICPIKKVRVTVG